MNTNRSEMSDGGDARSSQSSFEAQLPLIDSAIHRTAHRAAMRASELDEFRSYVFEKLLERSQRRLRAFRGQCAFSTYIIAVVRRLLLEYRRQEWGRWRPSARAKKSGNLAIELERLTACEGFSREEAEKHVLSSDPSLQEADVAELASTVDAWATPRRKTLPFDDVAEESFGPRECPERAYVARCEGERRIQALRRAINELTESERRFVRHRFWEERRASDIAGKEKVRTYELSRMRTRILRQLKRSMKRYDPEASARIGLAASYLPQIEFSRTGERANVAR